MSQPQRASKALDQFAAEVAKQAQRNLAGSPTAATLAVRLAIEQINHKDAQALIQDQETSLAQCRSITEDALALLERNKKIADHIEAGKELLRRLKEMDDAFARQRKAIKAINARHDQDRGNRQIKQATLERFIQSPDVDPNQFAKEEALKIGRTPETVRRWLREWLRTKA